MKNILKKTNAPYLVTGALAIGTLLAAGVFAVAPYVGFLAPVAALSVGLPFIVGGAIFSAVTIALSAVAINKNKTISQQEKFSNRVAQRKEEEAKARAELKAEGLLPDVIKLPEISQQENQPAGDEKDTKTPSPENEPAKEESGKNWTTWLTAGWSSRNMCYCSILCYAVYSYNT